MTKVNFDFDKSLLCAENQEGFKALNEAGIYVDNNMQQNIQKLQNENILPDNIQVPSGLYRYIHPKAIKKLLTKLTADKIASPSKNGKWFDVEIIHKRKELTGNTTPYSFSNAAFNGDSVDARYSTIKSGAYYYSAKKSYNTEKADQLSIANINYASDLSEAIVETFNRKRNAIYFNGINTYNPERPVYGLFNSPRLLPVQSVSVGAGGSTLWSNKTAQEIEADFRELIGDLTSQYSGTLNMLLDGSATLKVIFPNSRYEYLLNSNQYQVAGSLTLIERIKNVFTNFNMELIFAPELEDIGTGDCGFFAIVDMKGELPSAEQSFIEKMRAYPVFTRGTYQEQYYAAGCSGCLTPYPLLVIRKKGI